MLSILRFSTLLYGVGVALRPSASTLIRIASAATVAIHIPTNLALTNALWRFGPLLHRSVPRLLAFSLCIEVLLRTPLTFVIGLSSDEDSMPFGSRIAFLCLHVISLFVNSQSSVLTFLVSERGPANTSLAFCSIYSAKQSIRGIDIMSDLVLVRYTWDQVRFEINATLEWSKITRVPAVAVLPCTTRANMACRLSQYIPVDCMILCAEQPSSGFTSPAHT